MCGTLATTGVHDLAHGNRPEFVAMAVKQPENPCDIGMNDWITTDGEEERALLSAELDDEHIGAFVESNKAINTVQKTRSDINVWYRWCELVKEHRKLEDTPTEDLNRLLSHFFIGVRKRSVCTCLVSTCSYVPCC